jgi:uncharacterized small protein (DUF1192 family)
MAIPARSRWWIATLLIVAVLLGISGLALDRPDVVWDAAGPHCPFCRSAVELYSSRCTACRGDFDWTVQPEEASPIATDSLSMLAAVDLRERIGQIGEEDAARRVASAVGLGEQAAALYLATVGRGDCGWCGGTRRDLTAPVPEDAPDCPLCFGSGRSIACGGNRRVEHGNWAAQRALEVYEAELEDMRDAGLPAEVQRREARRLAARFLGRFAGTAQARGIYFWERVPVSGPEDLAVDVAGRRLRGVRRALGAVE